MPNEEIKHKIEGLRGEYKKNFAAAKTLMDQYAGKDDIPPEISKQIDALFGKADRIEVDIGLNEKLLKGEEYLAQVIDDPKASAVVTWRGAGPEEGSPEVDVKSWREMEIPAVYVDPAFMMPVVGVKRLRYHIPLCVQGKGYAFAHEAYMRYGKAGMGPNDLKTLAEGVDSTGGYLVPEEYHAELIRKIATNATIRANARVISTGSDVAKWTKVVWTTDDKYTSGVRMTWTGESPSSSTVHRVTDPVFGAVNVPVHTAMASMPLSNDLIEDAAFDVIGLSSDLMAEAYALGENDAFINGNGVMRPLGILADVDTDGPTSVVSGTAATLLPGGLIDLAYALPAQYDRNSKWYMSKATEKVIRKLTDTQGNYLWPIWPQMGNLAGATPRELLGYPTLRDEFLPAVGAGTYPIIFGDMTGYLVVDRVGFSIERLREKYAEDNVTVLLARRRLGGQTVEPWRLKVQKVAAS